MYKITFIGLILFLENSRSEQFTESPLKNKYDGYGDDWIFMPDGNNQPQVAILKGSELEYRSFGDEGVTFHLFTRYLLTHND